MRDYCTWILDKNHWGGAVEARHPLQALRKGNRGVRYSERCDSRRKYYGQGENYTERVMVLYDGLHYDAMVCSLRPVLPARKVT